MKTYLTALVLWLTGHDHPSIYHYGKVIGFDQAEARKNRFSGNVDIRFSATGIWTRVRPEYKDLFWYIQD